MALVLAAAQYSSFPGDVAGNVKTHVRFGNIAAENGVRLLVFPELSLIGYELELAKANPVLPDDSRLDPLRSLAVQAGMTLVAGAPLPDGRGGLYIGAFAFQPDGAVLTYAKVHVHSSEEHVFISGPGGPMVEVENAKVALAICRDAAIPRHAAQAAAAGATVYTAGAMITGDAYEHKAALLREYAAEHGMTVLLANYSGKTGGEQSAGRSTIWAEDGTVVASSGGNELALIIGRKTHSTWTGSVLTLCDHKEVAQ